ncbi:NTP transferase domain-containing protein [Mucilaginibacter terrae]|uniref:Molybdopterin-guanine dinucleotide biosynthesis protein A n=1 Tax=Mucilaginibacter terrae TaxID=1955052 RepID=A0ABU3GU87_9SPHI|nr:NTP transferase domain-containing protein [Mucilaginibacter terrae]MDT3403136.1 molybdopterin-guanine dinucleotide biosynthesis protein A [Mucilaginibacter terrae]
MAKHQKHAKLSKPGYGEFHRNELAILGTNCAAIRNLVNGIIQELNQQYNIAYVDTEHNGSAINEDSVLTNGGSVEFIDKITYRSISYKHSFNPFQNRVLFNEQDFVLVNGNHFIAQSQVIVIDPAKPLEKKLEKLTNVQLILLTDDVSSLPDYLIKHLPVGFAAPILKLSDTLAITTFVSNWLKQKLSPLNGLVLAGGKSERMQTDKGGINYFGQSQRIHMHELLSAHCAQTFISYANAATINAEENLPAITDTFIGLGSLGGILSAFQNNPNTAWLTVACDLPYLSAQTLAYLVEQRNPSKMATCFMDSDSQFPEPLITIWEPRAYPAMLQFLSQGYSCPRKVLINSEVELLQVPDVADLQNINYPEERDRVMQHLQRTS